MKKLILGIATTILMAAGLVAVSSGTANAAPCPYTGCVSTTTTVKAKTPGKHKIKVKFKVTTAGNVVPRGTVTVAISGPESKSKTTRYPGHKTAKFKKLEDGTYTITVEFTPGPSTAFEPSSASTTVTVG